MATTLNRGRMLPAPLPWLTALIKPRVKDYVDVTIHILHPLAVIACEASYMPHSNNGEASAQDRALIKQYFVSGVYYGTSSTELKRQLLGIPFDEFFNLCMCELPYLEEGARDRTNEQNELLWYLLSCAMHPKADLDGTLAPYLQRYYEWTFWPRDPNPETYFLSSFNEQVEAVHKDDLNVFPGMTRFIGDNISLQDVSIGSVEHMVKHFLWLAMNAVDIYLAGVRLRSNGRNYQQCAYMMTEAGEVLAMRLRTWLRNPFSSIPVCVRRALGTANIAGNVSFLIRCSIPMMLIKRTASIETLHQSIYLLFLSTTLRKIQDLGADPAGVISSNMMMLYRQSSLDSITSDKSPIWTRPVGMDGLVTKDIESIILRFESGPTADVPVIPTGPRVDPGGLSDITTKPPETERCPVCLDGYIDVDDMCVKLRDCAHLLHLGCLGELVNGAYPGSGEVRCPVCRAHLCATRDYTAVLDNENRTT